MLSTVLFLFISATMISAHILIKSCILYISYLLNEIASGTTCYSLHCCRCDFLQHSSYHFSLNTLDDSPVAQRKKPKILRPSSGSRISFQTYLLRSFCTFYISVHPTSQALQKCFSLSYFQNSFSLECPLTLVTNWKVSLNSSWKITDFLGKNYSLLCIVAHITIACIFLTASTHLTLWLFGYLITYWTASSCSLGVSWFILM